MYCWQFLFRILTNWIEEILDDIGVLLLFLARTDKFRGDCS